MVLLAIRSLNVFPPCSFQSLYPLITSMDANPFSFARSPDFLLSEENEAVSLFLPEV